MARQDKKRGVEYFQEKGLKAVARNRKGWGMKKSVEDRIVSRLGRFVDVLKAGKAVTKEFTCRTVVLDLDPVAYDPKMVKATRKLLRASQSIFAKFLGASVSTVRAWEQGASEPCTMACRFMDEIQRNPEYWRERLTASVRVKTGAGQC